ncbi:uncharacterized protein SPSK_07617 [Sporothrix schenckii 1099-18]|uniref:AB hydrolase-1 domain-containing protein n=2 Tax=Sporothrix schenckii TaxID=29908 RepID=U7PZL6_SPOS1|nr:uncharacterized protein SPSK_07617 [Sporothrix schenckii 1099-18]ERT01089.1 hypothetical protein HMPREF1624_02328 [Sporothrix schenckii ATCC 58251]KJR88221.1 hypothetical protein SPSK_07617 [Sporothrix schenckii 1099-18]
MPVWLSYPSRPTRGRGSPPPPPPTAATKHCLVYFVPGNPGFIDYYEPFLSTLRARLDEVEDKKRAGSDGRDDLRFHLLGRNLLGFDDGDDGGGSYGPGPFDLDTQTRAVWDTVANARVDVGAQGGPRHGTAFDEVVLMGHSVGSYIALDVFRRQQAAHPEGRPRGHRNLQKKHSPSESDKVVPVGGTGHLNLRLGVLLFATLNHLALSKRGQKLERVLLTTPVVSAWADVLAQAVVWWLLPVWLLAAVVHYVLRFPPHAAATTLRFLTSRRGVRQALFLGRDELQKIGPDEWEDELWEVAAAGGDAYGERGDNGKHARPKFVILFGEDDHWVDNGVRDEFIARRNAHAASRAQIVLDERGWPHDFCIWHGEEVAETVTTWLDDLAESL